METLAHEKAMTIELSWPKRRRLAIVSAELIRVMLASILLFSGLAKLRAPYEFLASVYGYQLTGPLTSLIIATVLPWLEVLVAICLWAKILYRGALAVAMMLTTLFALAVGIALYRQLDISCGCFIADDKISYFTFLRSIFLVAASMIGLYLAQRSPDAHSP
jgi:uncharacterized membrane protein YphA (DoxX/SURF4 family)